MGRNVLRYVTAYEIIVPRMIPNQINLYIAVTKLLQKSEMRKEIVIELSYKGFSRASDYS